MLWDFTQEKGALWIVLGGPNFLLHLHLPICITVAFFSFYPGLLPLFSYPNCFLYFWPMDRMMKWERATAPTHRTYWKKKKDKRKKRGRKVTAVMRRMDETNIPTRVKTTTPTGGCTLMLDSLKKEIGKLANESSRLMNTETYANTWNQLGLNTRNWNNHSEILCKGAPRRQYRHIGTEPLLDIFKLNHST